MINIEYYIYILIMRIYYINPFVGLLTGCQQAYTTQVFRAMSKWNYTSIKIWQYVCYIVLFQDVSEKFETIYRTMVSVLWSSLGSLSQQRVVRGRKWTFLLCEEKVNHVEYGQPGMLEASFMVVGLHMWGLDQCLKILRC